MSRWSLESNDNPSVNRKHRPDFILVLYLGLLMLFGLMVIFAIGPQRANVLNNIYGSNYSESYFFIKQAISMGIAISAFIFMAFIPYKKLFKRADIILIAALVSCVLLAIAGAANLEIAQKTLGATRWFNLGIFGTLQPAEILKFAILLFFAVFLGNRASKGNINNFTDTLLPLSIISAISLLFIVIIQKDLGTGIALTGIITTMLFIGGVDKKRGSIILLSLLAVGVVFIISAPHRVSRVLTYFKGDNISNVDSASSGGYHIMQAKLAIGSGGLFGVGIGNSVQSTGYLPEAVNDSVFAILCETFGLVGAVIILVVFAGLLIRLLKIMDHLIDNKHKLIVAGLFGWLGCHVILNIASMLGVFPLTGITLPFLSFGGTSMIFLSAALGLVFQLSHYTVHSSTIKEAQYENTSSWRGVRRSRHSSHSSSKRDKIS